MPRNVWNDIVSWQTGRLNNSTKYQLHALIGKQSYGEGKQSKSWSKSDSKGRSKENKGKSQENPGGPEVGAEVLERLAQGQNIENWSLRFLKTRNQKQARKLRNLHRHVPPTNGTMAGVLRNGMMTGVLLDGTKLGNKRMTLPQAHFHLEVWMSVPPAVRSGLNDEDAFGHRSCSENDPF